MEGLGDKYYLCCEKLTKYKCITCSAPACSRCSSFENDEKVDRWRAGMCVDNLFIYLKTFSYGNPSEHIGT